MSSTTELRLNSIDGSRHRASGEVVQNDSTSGPDSMDRELASLPPPDTGRAAWLFLMGSFSIEALVWGFPFSFGVFQEYYRTHPPFSEAPGGITIIGSSAMGVMYLGAPFVSMILQRFPLQRRTIQGTGFAIMVLTLVLSSFATTVWHLIITQGVLYAIAGSLVYFPTIVWLDEWFVLRKGFAFGVMWAGTGVSGIIIPIVMNWGLNKYGYATMLRAWAVVLVLFAGPLLFFVRSRIPVGRGTTHPRRVYYGFLRTWTFWALEIGSILESLGFFIPNIYLPTYSNAIGLSTLDGAITVALFNTTSVFGTVLMGTLSDRLHVTSVILISTIGATASVFLFWGLAKSMAMLCMFSLVYGLFAGGYSSTWTGISKEVSRKDDRAELSLVFGLLAAGRGIGSVISGPLSEALVYKKPWQGEALLGYGSGYGGLIVLTGVSALLGGSSWVFRRAGLI